jgi:chromosome segregation ATPase
VNIQELEPVVEVTHLRRLLDTQPSCLMRLGSDGTVLAANDAALKLIGVTSGAQVLGRDFSVWVPSDQRARWTTFTTGVVQGNPASVECDIAAPSGDRQPTLFHGVPLTDHPDGVASMAIAARVVSGQRQLEAAVIELEEQLREREAERFKARARLAESEARQRELAEKVGALEASLRPLDASAEHDEQVRQLKADLEARDAALGAAEAARRAAEATAAQALADVQQLEVALDGFAARQKQVIAERAAERQRLAEMTEVAASRQDQLLNAGRDSQERDRLAARLQEREAAVRGLEAAWTEKLAELEEARSVRHGLEAALLEAQQALAGEQERGQAGRAERDALQTRLGEALAACQEGEAALRELEGAYTSLAAAHSSLTTEHTSLTAEHASLTAEHASLTAEHASLTAEHASLTAEHASLTAEHASLTAEHALLTTARDRLVRALRQQVVHLDALANGFPAAGADAGGAPGDAGTGGEEGHA